VRLLAAQELAASEAFVKGSGFFVGQHLAQGTLTVLVASSASATIRSREEK
jgi:hypothetical protein